MLRCRTIKAIIVSGEWARAPPFAASCPTGRLALTRDAVSRLHRCRRLRGPGVKQQNHVEWRTLQCLCTMTVSARKVCRTPIGDPRCKRSLRRRTPSERAGQEPAQVPEPVDRSGGDATVMEGETMWARRGGRRLAGLPARAKSGSKSASRQSRLRARWARSPCRRRHRRHHYRCNRSRR
jgi:hypothetical protein